MCIKWSEVQRMFHWFCHLSQAQTGPQTTTTYNNTLLRHISKSKETSHHFISSLFLTVNTSQFISLYSGQLQTTNCHRPGINWQLHVVTCTVFTQHYGTATVPKLCLVPREWVRCVDEWLNLSALVSQSAGTHTHTWTLGTQRDLCRVTTAHKSDLNKAGLHCKLLSTLWLFTVCHYYNILERSLHTGGRILESVFLLQLLVINDYHQCMCMSVWLSPCDLSQAHERRLTVTYELCEISIMYPHLQKC